MPEDATAQRKRRVLAHYGKNLAGKLVRKSAFRECDYTPEGHLWEFDTEDAVQAFEKARYEDGTGHNCFMAHLSYGLITEL